MLSKVNIVLNRNLLSFLIYAVLFSPLFSSCGSTNKQAGQQHGNKANHLINESSPYLLQHAYNPVNWYPWGEEALNKAKEENKLLIISIGYSACHWCHVMEHESFEDSTIAAKMNSEFVSIKVDREERPDVDQVYMDAALITMGSGGWPLNAIALPDGRPVFALTYLPKDKWLYFLNQISNTFENKPEEIYEQATQVAHGISQKDFVPNKSDITPVTSIELDNIFAVWDSTIDYSNGGRLSNSNKFPMPNNWEYLLMYSKTANNPKAEEAVYTTLDKIAMGGIYDQIGGGFARYSTDPIWKVPHFEKMLYDNGQLVSLYSKAYQNKPNELYKNTVYETLEYIEREMTSKEGGFYSSLDADSDGEEGKFYVWTSEEIKTVLGKDMADVFNKYYGITPKGNWEDHKNVLMCSHNHSDAARLLGLSDEDLKVKVKQAKEKLMEVRNKRIRPGLDDKILTSWNALMLKGYVDAYRVFDEQKFLDVALKNAQFIVRNCIKDDDYRMNRNYKDGKSSINAFLDDYSFTIEAFIALYQATFDEQWLYKAKGLADYAIEHFYDEQKGMFYYTSNKGEKLVSRKMEISDNVIPGSNSSMAKGLYYLGLYLYNKKYEEMAVQMVANVKANITEQRQASFYSNWCILMAHLAKAPYEVAIVGDDFEAKRKEIDKHYLPDKILLGGKDEGSLELLKNKKVDGRTMIYVCRQKVCKFPVEDVKKALSLMD